ncbi:MAG TPA: ABC transporter ATP-binding protein [Acidimicrobiales bacterium]|nr:ABC transporter ATP-binding protein [Acidimicrobiales bacterium]
MLDLEVQPVHFGAIPELRPPQVAAATEEAVAAPRRAGGRDGDGDGAGRWVLECEGLTKRFGTRVAVDGIGFRIAEGETYGLLGPNGAGKTTTMKIVCGLLAPDAGTVTVAGRPVGHDLGVKNLIGYVPQDVALYPDLTADENLEFLGSLYRLGRRTLRRRVDEALEATDLADRRHDRVDSFSGGMKRRLNIAAGLLNRPRLLVLDEPTVGVDPQSRHAILERVQAFGREGMAVVYATHYMEEAERVCSRVGIIDHGQIVAEGTRRELVARLGERDRIELTASGDLSLLATACGGVDGVDQAVADEGVVHLVATEARHVLPAVLEAANVAGCSVTSVDVVEPDLEAVFLHLTGSALRE